MRVKGVNLNYYKYKIQNNTIHILVMNQKLLQ